MRGKVALLLGYWQGGGGRGARQKGLERSFGALSGTKPLYDDDPSNRPQTIQ